MREGRRQAPRQVVIERLNATVEREGFHTVQVGGAYSLLNQMARLLTSSIISGNIGTNFPMSISLNGQALFCTGSVIQSASLQPGNYLDQNAMSFWPPTAAQARATAQQQILAAGSSNQMIQAANKAMSDALALNPLLKSAATTNSDLTDAFVPDVAL